MSTSGPYEKMVEAAIQEKIHMYWLVLVHSGIHEKGECNIPAWKTGKLRQLYFTTYILSSLRCITGSNGKLLQTE